MSPAYALNRCVDSAGKVNYTDMPCEAEEKSGAVNLSGVGKSDTPQIDRNSERFTTSNRTAAIQAYLQKTEAERAQEKERKKAGTKGIDKAPSLTAGQMPPAGGLTTEMEKEIARLSKQLKAARSQVEGKPVPPQ